MEALKKAATGTVKAVNSVFDSDEEEKEKNNKKDKKLKKKKGSKKKDEESDDDSSIDSEDVELAADITADVFTGGMYGTVTGAIEAYEAVEEYQAAQEEEKKKKEEEKDEE